MNGTQTTATRRELRLVDKRARRWRYLQRPTTATAMVVAITVVSALLGAGTSQAFSDQQLKTARAAVAAAVAHENANRLRSNRADGARYEGAAIAFATVKRSEAVVRANEAVAHAVSTRASSAPDVTPETLTPLDAAVLTLTALIEAAPAAPLPIPVETPDPRSTGDLTVLGPADPHLLLPAEPTVAARVVEVPPPAPVVSLRAVDLELSAQMLAAAQLVTDLSAQIAAVADANVAAAAAAAAQAAAQAAADEAARVTEAAAQAAAAGVAQKVKAVKAAPNGEIPVDLMCPVAFDSSLLLRCDAAEALDRLAVAFRAAFGRDPRVVSSYRTFSEQVFVRQARGGLAAVPGSSNHGRGLAVDLAGFGSLGQFTAPGYRWMKDNAAEFGWYHPAFMEPGGGGPLEPWHWEFDTD